MKEDEIVVFEINHIYPGNLSREEATAILGFDPGPPSSKPGPVGYIASVDKEKGVIIISTKTP